MSEAFPWAEEQCTAWLCPVKQNGGPPFNFGDKGERSCISNTIFSIPMYRVTYSESVSQEWAARNALGEAQKRRVYRWGTHWGTLASGWSCESRTQVTANDDFLVESCTFVHTDILPKEMDDIWEEEYVSLAKGLEYTGLVILKGDAGTVLELAAAQGLPTPVLPITLAHVPLNANKPKPMKSRCVIQD